MKEIDPKKKNMALDLDGTLLDSRLRHVVVLTGCINQINETACVPDDFNDFLPYKSEGKNGYSYLKYKNIPNEKAIITLWMNTIEFRKYLRLDRLYPNVLSDLIYLSELYNLFLITARSNKPNAIWQISQLNIGDFFQKIIVVKSAGNVGWNKYIASKPTPLDYVIGDTEGDLAFAKYAQCHFFPLNDGFRSAEFWMKNGLKSYHSINDFIRKSDDKIS